MGWIRMHAPNAYSSVNIDLEGNTYTGANVLRDSAEHGRSIGTRPFAMILGSSDDRGRVKGQLSNKT